MVATLYIRKIHEIQEQTKEIKKLVLEKSIDFDFKYKNPSIKLINLETTSVNDDVIIGSTRKDTIEYVNRTVGTNIKSIESIIAEKAIENEYLPLLGEMLILSLFDSGVFPLKKDSFEFVVAHHYINELNKQISIKKEKEEKIRQIFNVIGIGMTILSIVLIVIPPVSGALATSAAVIDGFVLTFSLYDGYNQLKEMDSKAKLGLIEFAAGNQDIIDICEILRMQGSLGQDGILEFAKGLVQQFLTDRLKAIKIIKETKAFLTTVLVIDEAINYY